VWLVTTLLAALIVIIVWKFAPNLRRYRTDILGLMLWGATVMILIDHILGYEGGEFLEATTNGMITNGALLGVVMLVPVFIVWGAILMVDRSLKRRH